MSIFQRVKSAVSAFNHPEMKAAPYSYVVRGNGQPIWQTNDYASYVKNAFEQNAVINAAIMYKVRAIALTRLKAYTGDPDNPTPLPVNHALSKMLVRPNPHMSWIDFEGLNTVYMNLDGNAYIFIDRSQKDAPARYPLRPDRVRMMPDSTGIKGYLYVPSGKQIKDGIPFLPEEIIHNKMPNALDDYEGMGYGLSPLKASAQTLDVDNAVTQYLKVLFQNGAMPMGLLKVNVPLNDAQAAELRRKWQDRYGGVNNWGDIGVLDSQADYQRLSMNFQELGFDSIDERSEARLLSPLGVPGILLDTRISMKASTYANKAEARKAFWEDTFSYEIAKWDNHYEYHLTDERTFVQRDLSGVPALQKNTPELVNAAKIMWSMGVPLNTALKAVGLKIPPVEGGDVSYLPMAVQEVGALDAQAQAAAARLSTPVADTTQNTDTTSTTDTANATTDSATTAVTDTRKAMPSMVELSAELYSNRDENPLPQEKKSRWSVQEKRLIWKEMDSIALKHEPAAIEASRKAFEKDRRAILSLIDGAQDKALQSKATLDWVSVIHDIDLFLKNASPANWRTEFVPVFETIIDENGQYWSEKLGFAWDVRNITGEAWFEDYTLKFAQPINETSSGVLHDILAQGQAEGWSIPKMEKAINTTFKEWLDGDVSKEERAWIETRSLPHRVEMIARTETTRIQAAGAQVTYKDWGVLAKEWLSTADDRTRDTHIAVDGQSRGIDEPFDVGGYDMMQPGDMSMGAPVREIVNC